MRSIQVPLFPHNPQALDSALRKALAADYVGLSTTAADLIVWLADSAPAIADATANAVLAAHAAISLSVDRAIIRANGSDRATLTIRVDDSRVTALTLLIGDQSVPIALTGHRTQLTLSALDPATIPVRVQDADNRTTDALTIVAV
jgi:hypothetical protein